MGIRSLYLGPLCMAVRDYIDGMHGEATKAKNMPPNARAQIEAMVIKLHESDQAFGDLRPPNVVFSDRKAYLVDSDWARKYGRPCTPRNSEQASRIAAREEILESLRRSTSSTCSIITLGNR